MPASLLAAVGDRFDARSARLTAGSTRPRARSSRAAWRLAGAVALVLWLAWNAWWLAIEGRLPPSALTEVAGVPCPTTGCTRSLLALGAGDWRGSLRHNALAVPIGVLFLLSVAWAAVAWARSGRARLPGALAWVWAGVLTVAWVTKLASGGS